MHSKKLLSLLLVLALSLCLLAGCGGDQTGPDSGNPGDGEDAAPTTGMLVFNANAALEICYTAEGLVYSVNGVDDNGISISDRLSDYLDKPCGDVIKTLVDLCVEAGYLTEETPAIILKQGIDSVLPDEDFPYGIAADIRGIVKDVPVIVIPEASLAPNGYMTLDAAKGLLVSYLGLEDISDVTGEEEVVQGLYALSIESPERIVYYTVDATTGTVAEGYPGGSVGDNILNIDPNGAMYDPENPELFPDETEPLPDETEPDSFDEGMLDPEEFLEDLPEESTEESTEEPA